MASIKKLPIEQRFRKTVEYYRSDRSDLKRFIRPGDVRILDIGCGAGQTWAHTPYRVWGIERQPEAAEQARHILQDVFSGDADVLEPPFEKSFFDCLFLADILEHLVDPWGLLLKFRSYLKPDGVVVTSIPNVQHYRVLKRLLFRSEFRYATDGVLDVDHLRFFALRDIEWMFAQSGFRILSVDRRLTASALPKLVNALTFGCFRNFLTEQYYVVAQRN